MEKEEIMEICSEALTKDDKEGLNIVKVLSVEMQEVRDSDYEAEVEYIGEVNIEELRKSYSSELIYAKELEIKIKRFSGDGSLYLSINEN